MSGKLYARLALALALALSAAPPAGAQSGAPAFGFRRGQAMYIVAFTRSLVNVSPDAEQGGVAYREYFDFNLDAERKVRKRVEEWKFFRVADKPSDADFVFLVNIHDSSMEGLAVPFDAYTRHFKEKFDLDALRDAAYGRYLAGPLKLPTIARLSDRLVRQFRERLSAGGAAER